MYWRNWLFVGVVTLILAPKVMAESSVKIGVSNNGSGSENNVKVTQSSNTTSTTDVKVETNGEVKTFHADDGEEIDYQSEDGGVKVQVNSDVSSQSEKSAEEVEEEIYDSSESGELSPTPKIDTDEVIEETEAENNPNLLERLVERVGEWLEAVSGWFK